jgi:hypothetical protein
MHKRVRITLHTEVEVTIAPSDGIPDANVIDLAERMVMEKLDPGKVQWDMRSQILEEC